MPYDLYLNNLNDKSAVIFDIGSAYTKLGFSGENSPRAIIPSLIKIDNGVKYIYEADNEEEERKLLINFLYEIYYRKLLVNPKDRRVVILESILSPSKKRNLLANVLFKHFEVPSVLFAPIHLVSLFTLGLQSGLVLDCGYKEANIVPVFEGYHLLENWQAASLGALQVEHRLLSLIQESGTMIDSANNVINMKEIDNIGSILTREVLEDIKVRSCVVSPINRAAKWRDWLNNKDECERPQLVQESFDYNIHCDRFGDICIKIPLEIREFGPEILFDSDNEEMSLAKLLLDAILSAPIDCRRVLCENIVVIGGSSQLPGFRSRLLAELRQLSSTCGRYRRLSIHLDSDNNEDNSGSSSLTFKIHEPPSQPNYTAWLGGAIFGELDTIAVRSLTRDSYLEAGGSVSDWTDSHRSRQ